MDIGGPRLTRSPRLARWALVAAPTGFLLVFFVWPTLALLLRGLLDADPGLASGSGVQPTILGAARTWKAVGATIGLAAGGTAVALACGLPAAWALFRVRWRGQAFVRALISVPFVLPTVVVATAFTAMLRRGGLLGFMNADQSVGAIVAALAFFNVAVVVRIVGGTWAAHDPDTVVAARTLGASPVKAFRAITLPALAPAIVSAASIVFLFCASSFAIVLVLGGTRVNTIETEIWIQVTQFLDLRAAATLAVVQLVVVGMTLAVTGWARSQNDRAIGIRRVDGSRAARRGDGRWVALALVPTFALLALPMIALGARSLRTSHGWGFDHFIAVLSTHQGGIGSVSIMDAARHSLVAAVVASALACGLGLALAHTLSARPSLGRRRRRDVRWLDSAIMLPLGVSSVIVGLGVLVTLNRPLPGGLDLSSPALLIPAAQAVIALPLVVRTILPTLRSIDPEVRHSASTLGASPWKVWRHVDWPLVRRPMGLALGFAFAVSFGEFGATSFLARPDYQTLPTAIVRLLSRPGIDNVGMAFATAVLLAILTGAIMMWAERLRTDEVAAI